MKASTARRSFRRYLPLAGIVAVLVLAYALGVQDYVSLATLAERRDVLRAYVADHLVLSAAGFVCFYAAATAFVFPAPVILTVASGFLFGWWLGGTLTVVGATIGACALFAAARTALGDILGRKAGSAVARFAQGFENDAFSYLLVLRLTPVVPFGALNIGPAFFNISLRTFACATFLGIIPGAMVYAFLGSGLDGALVAAGGAGNLDVGDLVTSEMTIALTGLCALSLLGLVLKKWVLGTKPAPVGEPR